ncbi:PhoH family protein [Mesorhizobium sp. M0320]|uniref:PhoH family protein n=1 Tax=Mesorhizobium sp. M0320 TaxID=2956936 RepID=UPI00333DAF01
MSSKPSKSAARNERRSVKTRSRNDDPLLRLVKDTDAIRREPVRARNELVKPLNDAQRAYDAAMKSSDIVFGIGPAGTGKTWLSIMRAAEALKAKRFAKIVLTRPAVEAGETLGFLPGELDEKFEPYIRPLRDALEEAFGSTHLEYLLKTGTIEARPLAYLRGSTIKDAWLIADEMQNATVAQFKMLLSRVGEGAKFIINGDPDQCDLKGGSGLLDAVRRLKPIEEVSTVAFTRADIVRSGLCAKIVSVYESPSDFRYNADNDERNTEGVKRFINAGGQS